MSTNNVGRPKNFENMSHDERIEYWEKKRKCEARERQVRADLCIVCREVVAEERAAGDRPDVGAAVGVEGRALPRRRELKALRDG